jgi:hypothetical protein
MSRLPCTTFADCGWVCETHPDRPSAVVSKSPNACHCGGAGMPCPVCNVVEDGEMPGFSRTGITVTHDDKGPRH